jgi:NTP pyrophosphatase (non-canonical NTP hydrolase)
MTLDEIQKQVYQNKVEKGFNTTNVEKEFCYLYGEVGEAYDAFLKKKDDLGTELADIAIYLLGIAEILGFSLKDEIEKKVQINKSRKYEYKNGVLVKS